MITVTRFNKNINKTYPEKLFHTPEECWFYIYNNKEYYDKIAAFKEKKEIIRYESGNIKYFDKISFEKGDKLSKFVGYDEKAI